ncbi:MAG: pyridoxal 5'-phosphate synthase glutaminase subunit PdxT [Candidatus Kerfeldbacteria bacterium]|nr:pyridoxal 5'-phosphate synthase glutaminase subunit PdxT [Candidatus Kerfeldbacteria bacterium]
MALQGDFAEHITALRKLKLPCLEVRTIADIKKTTGLIMPGGESTTIGKLLVSTGLDAWLKTHVKKGYTIYGTCAGAILLSQLGLINITVKRNAYGRQLDSFDEPIQSKAFPKLRGVFIRAPLFTTIGKGVTVLATHDGDPVLVQQGKILAGSFHPELTDNLAVHRYFATLAK